jgi:fluoride exporter
LAELSWFSIAVVFAGGGTGSVLRFAITKFSLKWFGAYPYGTLIANLAGALLAGIVAVMVFEKRLIQPPWNDLLLAGFLGGLTTFSAMILDAHRLTANGNVAAAVFYVLLNVMLGFALFTIAHQITRTA